MKVKELKALLDWFQEDEVVVIEYDKALIEITKAIAVKNKTYTKEGPQKRGKFPTKTGDVVILTTDLI